MLKQITLLVKTELSWQLSSVQLQELSYHFLFQQKKKFDNNFKGICIRTNTEQIYPSI